MKLTGVVDKNRRRRRKIRSGDIPELSGFGVHSPHRPHAVLLDAWGRSNDWSADASLTRRDLCHDG